MRIDMRVDAVAPRLAGPFLFTHYLMDTLKATPNARIVWQASGGESIGKARLCSRGIIFMYVA